MADFRKWFYALAVVALLAGLTVPASAQAPPFVCQTNAGVPPIVRAEGYTELVGDVTLDCTGGVPTPVGAAVPQVNVTILLSTNITSRLLTTTGFSEALLIIDEPHSAVNPTRPLTNCGLTGEDSSVSGPGVCSIIQPAYAIPPGGTVAGPINTYDGTTGTTAFGSSRPNVFQGRIPQAINNSLSNSVVFLGVPLDPPGTVTHRTLRITNVRANAVATGVSSTFTTSQIQMNISVNGNTSLAINNPQQIVAYVQRGLTTQVINPNLGYLQCNDENPSLYNTLTNGNTPGNAGSIANTPQQAVRFSEGFASSWKAKNFNHILTNGTLQSGANYRAYNGLRANPVDVNQNVPGAIYNTESAFENQPPPIADPSPNPPLTIGTTPVTATTNAFASPNGTGISNAGIANQGTRLAMSFSSLPQGTAIWVPSFVYLYRQGAAGTNAAALAASLTLDAASPFSATPSTGVAVLTTTAADGSGAFSAAGSTAAATEGTLGSANTLVPVGSSNLAVYEILFADPFSLESFDVPVVVAYVQNLSQNLPAPGVTAQVAGGFAPFYTTAAAGLPSTTLPIPRFIPGNTPANLYAVTKCACNLLFPYVVSAAGFDTGIAIANTSVDPGVTFGFNGIRSTGTPAQSGTVQFWYYGVTASGGAAPATQCTNAASPGTCPGATSVPGGQVLTYVLSSGGGAIGAGPNGLDNRANGFIGYVIAQAQFQFCHAFAYISALGAGPLTPGMSVGYLGLILDKGGLQRTNQLSENLVH